MFRALAVSSLRLSLMLPTATFHILYPRPCSKSLVQCGRLLVCSPDEDFTLNGLPRISTESGHVETVSLAKHHSTLRFTSSTDEIICSLKGATCLNAKKMIKAAKPSMTFPSADPAWIYPYSWGRRAKMAGKETPMMPLTSPHDETGIHLIFGS